MATKAQLVNYIADQFETQDGIPASLAKLDSYKKAELEEFIKANNCEADVEAWLANQK